MFMVINEVAYDLLVENPMTGYMNDIVLSRVLGHDEIEGSGYWIDSTQCWVCSKWNKAVISYHQAEDKMLFQKKALRVEELHRKINVSVAKALGHEEDELEVIHRDNIGEDSDQIEEVPEEDEATTRFGGSVGQQTFQTTGLRKTLKSSIKHESGHDVINVKTQQSSFAKSIKSGGITARSAFKDSTIRKNLLLNNQADEVLSEKDSLEETSEDEVDKPHLERFDNTSPL